MKKRMFCNDCRYSWRTHLPQNRSYCPACSGADIVPSTHTGGRPEKYPWDKWAEEIRTSGKPIQLLHETPTEASKQRSRIASNKKRREQFRVALRGCKVYLHLVA